MAPSSWHGVTTVVMGNCGVGFAPAAPDKHDWLIGLMEGVEDIPGTALSEGLPWNWETFPQYLDSLEEMSRTIDVATHVPHGPVRAYVMGERGARNEAPTEEEIQAKHLIADLTGESVVVTTALLGGKKVVTLKNLTDCRVELPQELAGMIKLFVEGCVRTTVALGCKLVTSHVEASHCEGLELRVEREPLFTVQARRPLN